MSLIHLPHSKYQNLSRQQIPEPVNFTLWKVLRSFRINAPTEKNYDFLQIRNQYLAVNVFDEFFIAMLSKVTSCF